MKLAVLTRGHFVIPYEPLICEWGNPCRDGVSLSRVGRGDEGDYSGERIINYHQEEANMSLIKKIPLDMQHQFMARSSSVMRSQFRARCVMI